MTDHFNHKLFEVLPIGLAICDMEGNLTYVNPAYANMLGYTVQETLELTYWEVTPKEYERQEQKQLGSLEKTGNYGPYEKEYIHKDGRRFPVRLSGVLITEKNEKLIWSSVEDISEKVLSQKALKTSEANLAEAQRIAGIGSWEFNAITGEAYWSDERFRIFGYKPGEIEPSLENFKKSIHPDDRDRVASEMMNAIKSGEILDTECRISLPDGEEKIIHIIGETIREDDPNDTFMSGTVMDITERKKAEEKLLKRTHDLGERVKELTGLYALTEVLSHSNVSIEEALQGAVNILPPAWHYTEITCARITLNNNKFTTGNFKETIWRQTCDIIAQDGKAGLVEVFYLAKKPELDEGPFLNEERDLIEAIAKKISTYLDRKQIEESLLLAKDEAVSANRAKSDFLANMSHELRTPLNAVIGFSDTMKEAIFGPLNEKYIEYANDINSSGKHLLELVSDILDLAKLEHETIDLHIEEVPPKEIIGEIIPYISEMMDDRRIEFVDLCDGHENVSVLADKTKFKQALLNLFTNAIKYNTEGGKVFLGCEGLANGMTKITVEDTGLGIPLTSQPHLFEAFNRLGFDDTNIKGTGIGLTISKNLVELMGGRIDFESTEGQGSKFWIEIPCAAVDL